MPCGGVAVLAILMVHHVEHFIYPVYPAAADMPGWLNVMDEGVFTVTFGLFAGKSYSIFALLFGLTFYIQYTHQLAKGKDFGYRFLWRLLLLTLFATLNAAFYPAGDVLLLYDIVGIILFIVRKWSDRAILITAPPSSCNPWDGTTIRKPNQSGAYVARSRCGRNVCGNGGTYAKRRFLELYLAERDLGTEGEPSLGGGSRTVRANLRPLPAGYADRTEAAVRGDGGKQPFWLRALIVTAIAFCPLYQLKVLTLDTAESPMVRQTVGVAFDMWQKFAFTFVLVASFALLYQCESFKCHVAILRSYGKMSLTNYVSQSLGGALIYFPIGLNLAPHCGYAVSLLIGIAFFFLQARFCKWWADHHKRGPLEEIWHKWTWIR